MSKDEDSLDYWKSLSKSGISWQTVAAHPIGALFSQANKEKCRVAILYEDYEKESTNRLIFPLAPFTVGGVMYIRTYCFLRKEERTFRLDRVKEARVVPGSFEMPPGYVSPSAPKINVVAAGKNSIASESSDAWIVWAVIIGVILLWLVFKK